jgi:hypothetical protein
LEGSLEFLANVGLRAYDSGDMSETSFRHESGEARMQQTCSPSHPLFGLSAAATVKRDDGFSGPFYRCHVCGVLGEDAVLIENVEGTRFEQGERVSVQVTLRGRSIGFTSTVLCRSEKPRPHYFLSFPAEFEDLELRKSARVPALIPIRIVLGEEGVVVATDSGLDGVLINVSQDGCAFSTRASFPEQKNIQLLLNIPGEPGEYRLEVTVVNRKSSEPVYVHGAKFRRQSSESTVRAIDEWLARTKSYWPDQLNRC